MEELDIPSALKLLKPYDLSPIERVLAGHTGTVQVLLSLWFNEEVVVKVQEQIDNPGGIERKVHLALGISNLVVATATSVIPRSVNMPKVMGDVQEQILGLGQIAVKHQIPTSRRIIELSATDDELRRKYIMEGQGLRYVITENFHRRFYVEFP